MKKTASLVLIEMNKKYVKMKTKAGIGDYVCLLSACLEYSKKSGIPVCVDILPDVVFQYNDPMLEYWCFGDKIVLDLWDSHRNKNGCRNYYDTFLKGLGIEVEDPKLILPKFEKQDSRILIQPYSVYAQNPSMGYIQGLVDAVIEWTGQEVWVIGGNLTPRFLERVRYDLVGDGVTKMMGLIQNASLVLTPRSAIAHIAAWYGIPSFVWVPEDGENWHLDYSGWDRILHSYVSGDGKEEVVKFLSRNCIKI